MEHKNFEFELPEGYKKICHINALDKKFGLIFNGIALVVLFIVMGIAIIPLVVKDKFTMDIEPKKMLVGMFVFFVSMALYIVLHEIVHGIAYKALTKQKLTFGLSWSCAFCGVPNIYTYRKTTLIALLAPFVTFSIILIPLTVGLYFVHPLVYLASSFILGLHIGGCSGDLYMTILLVTKYKDKNTLIKDTGPEQLIYVKEK